MLLLFDHLVFGKTVRQEQIALLVKSLELLGFEWAGRRKKPPEAAAQAIAPGRPIRHLRAISGG